MFDIANRRYIGSKQKLLDWIFGLISKHCDGNSFADIFAGTGVVAATAAESFDHVILNDFLYSNYVNYQSFFGHGKYGQKKIDTLIDQYNMLTGANLHENYFSKNFGDKYYSRDNAKLIGHIREDIESKRADLTVREYCMLLSSLLYAVDKTANTVGHFDAYIRKAPKDKKILMQSISPIPTKKSSIYRDDANRLASKISADVVYIDPPYNSRQYSRFYHVLETLVKWDKGKLYGTALKPEPENTSDYCKTAAPRVFEDLVRKLRANYLVVSYNNTYEPKSSSSKNKITLQQIKQILDSKGSTKVFKKEHRFFNAGKTEFPNHQEYLFITRSHDHHSA